MGGGDRVDGESFRILSAVRAKEGEASGIIERAHKEGERMELEARERAEKSLNKGMDDAHAHAALYLEKARLEAHKEAERIRADGKKKESKIEKEAGKKVQKAVDFIVSDFLRGVE